MSDLSDEINNVIDDEIRDFFEGDIILRKKSSVGRKYFLEKEGQVFPPISQLVRPTL